MRLLEEIVDAFASAGENVTLLSVVTHETVMGLSKPSFEWYVMYAETCTYFHVNAFIFILKMDHYFFQTRV